MSKKEFEIELSRPGTFGAFTASTLTLPAAWTEIKDALDKARITDDRVIYGIEVLETKREYLLSRIPDNSNLYELNHLAEQLSEMDNQEADCFEGLVKMEASEIIDVSRLIHMTYSLTDCQINYAIKTDRQLGEFYVENELDKELSALPDSVLRLLDYNKVGQMYREAEHGVFTGQGYITCDSWPKLSVGYVPWGIPMTQNPEYPIVLKLEPADPSYGDAHCYLRCYATEEEFDNAVKSMDASSFEDCKYTCVDCVIPSLKEIINLAEDLSFVNEFTPSLSRIQNDGNITLYKALLEATKCDNLETAALLAGDVENYSLLSEMSSPDDYAKEYLYNLKSPIDLDDVTNLYSLGVKVMEHDNAAETSYGILRRKDGSPIQVPEPEIHGFSMDAL